jgi:hypothetical protein
MKYVQANLNHRKRKMKDEVPDLHDRRRSRTGRPTTSRHLSPCDAGAGRYDLATTEKDGATYDLARTERDTVRTWRSMKMRSR